MNMFTTTLNQMLFLFLCILIGFYLKKKSLLPDNASGTISKLENLVILPALLINSFSTNCSIESLKNNSDLLFWGLVFVLIQVILAFIITPLFKPTKAEKGVFLYSLCVVNFSFMGNSLISSLFGGEMLYKYLIFTIPLNMLAFSIGYVWLTSGAEKFSFKRLINPIMIGMLIGIVIGVTGINLPAFIKSTLNSLQGCFAPLAMILTGIVIGGYDIKKLLTIKRVYVLTLIRCIILPLIILYTAKYMGLDQTVLTLLIFISAMPLGLNSIVVPSAYGGDTTLGASMAVVSNILGIITVPLFLMLFL